MLLQQFRVQLVAVFGPYRNRYRHTFVQVDEVTVAGITGIRHQDFAARIHQQTRVSTAMRPMHRA